MPQEGSHIKCQAATSSRGGLWSDGANSGQLSAVQSSQSLLGARLERAVLGLCLARKGSGKLPLWSSQPGAHSSCELVLFRILGTSFTGTQFG